MRATHAIIHHSATTDGKTFSWGAIRFYHTETNGWDDIGYHYGIELIDDYYEVLVGRAPDVAGAHCKGFNHTSLGICFVGNYDLAPPPDAMMKRAVEVFAPIIRMNQIPIENIGPHSDFASKTCPGKMFPMEKFVAAIKRSFWI